MLNDNNIVEKSSALVWAKMTDYGVNELKILETYLSRIDARRPESACVAFTKKEYLELLGLDPETKTSQLKLITARLLRNVVTIDLPGEGYVQYNLFSEAEAKYDEKVGQVVIRIQCHDKLKDAFFDLAENGYVKYRLKNTISMRSQYSIRLYGFLMSRPFGWTVEIKELRERLEATKKTYKEFKRFNELVLQKAIKEINEQTDLNVDTEIIRKGRNAVAVKFLIARKKEPELIAPADIDLPLEGPVDFFEDVDNDPINDSIPDMHDPLALFMSALPDYFDRDQAILLRDLALDHLPPYIGSMEERELWLHDYVYRKVKLMATSRVENPFGWLRSAVENDYK